MLLTCRAFFVQVAPVIWRSVPGPDVLFALIPGTESAARGAAVGLFTYIAFFGATWLPLPWVRNHIPEAIRCLEHTLIFDPSL